MTKFAMSAPMLATFISIALLSTPAFAQTLPLPPLPELKFAEDSGSLARQLSRRSLELHGGG